MSRDLPPERLGFGADHVPAFKVPWRAKFKTVPTVFPTRKAAGGHVLVREPLAADLMIHFDTDPAIKKICGYPRKVIYPTYDRYGFSKFEDHIPALGILNEQGVITYADCIPLAIQSKRPWIERRTEALQLALWNDFGVFYTVFDERDIHIQPRLWNLRLIWRHHRDNDPADVNAVRRALDLMELPATIGDVRATIDIPPPIWRTETANGVFDLTLDDVDPVFSALMSLAFTGLIELNLSQRFSDETTITYRQKRSED
ncbi:hypothetical protein K6M90_07385 [Rhizobium sp. 9T]|uniref:hypothetical protein n=1 Tax=Rhizobium croatiense TaxID=2867516 RepID=UPI00103A6D18|nr:hypothetical protein [Rhizobium croatiense]MBY4607474.1 hypothetical protein [Rhizobium croatiense]TCA15210.1 hypothetical protein E0H70_35885 [Rhizobium leguminosarum bv. viciae]